MEEVIIGKYKATKKLAKLGYNNIIEFGGTIDWYGDTVAE